MNYYKLSNIREILQQKLKRPISKQLADYYTCIADFPSPKIEQPIRLWDKKAVDKWMKIWSENKHEKV
ncbi:MAG: hypothetical protein ACYCZF_13885 [Anaerolineae bacterium]